MRTPIQISFLLFVTVWCLAGTVRGENKTIVTIDMTRLFNDYNRTVAAKEKMEQQTAAFKAEMSDTLEAMRTLEEEFHVARQEAYDMALSESVREQRKTEAEEKMIELQNREKEVTQFREERKKELSDASNRLTEAILTEIKKKINQFAKSRGYFMVLDSSGSTLNRLPAVVYHDGSADITDTVLELLNSGADVTGNEAAKD